MSTRVFELADLRLLTTAADAGTLGRAALRLHVSQPALTRRLQNLETLAGVALLERSPRGVALTPAGRRVYEHARPLLAAAADVDALLSGLRQEASPIRLAASHSAVEAFVSDALTGETEAERRLAVELVVANSLVVRRLIAEGRADVGVAAGRPDATPNPAIREEPLCDDEIVVAVPRGHLWAQRGRIHPRELTQTPMVVRDRSSNARWTVDAVLRTRGLRLAPPLEEAPTPAAAKRAALRRNAPVMLSRRALAPDPFVPIGVDGLRFPRCFSLVLPGAGGTTAEVAELRRRLTASVTS